MPAYVDVATVMGSTANGTIVPSAYGDQVRDNLVAIQTGWWFKASRGNYTSVSAVPFSQIQMTTFDTAFQTGVTTASADGMASLSSGYIALTRAGAWSFSAWYPTGTNFGQYLSIGVSATQVSTQTMTRYTECSAISLGGIITVTTNPTYVGLWHLCGTNGAVGAPVLYGVWLGDA